MVGVSQLLEPVKGGECCQQVRCGAGGMADCVLVLTLGIAGYRGFLTDIEHHGHCHYTQLVSEAGHL